MNIEVLHVGPLGTNCYVVWDDNDVCAVVDIGGQADKVAEFIEEKHLKPSHILLTHGHGDHIGGVEGFLTMYPHVQVAMAEEDVEMITDRMKSMADPCNCEQSEFTPDILVNEGDIVKVGDMDFHVLKTPGHTEGGVTYIYGKMMFTGDTLFAGSMGRTDLYGASNEKMAESLKKLGSIEGYYVVLPGHGTASNLEDERRANPFIKKAMAGKNLL